jgi:copper chaperone CopZ
MRTPLALTTCVGLLVLVACSSPKAGGTYEEHPVTHTVTPADLAFAQSKDPLPGREAVLYVNGLGCPLCASNIDRQLERVPGVTGVKVDLSVGLVTLNLSGRGNPSPLRLGEAVEDAGFTLVKVEAR